MAQDPLSVLATMLQQQLNMMVQNLNQMAIVTAEVAMTPLKLASSVAQGSGIFDAKMTTQQLVDKNIFGAGS